MTTLWRFVFDAGSYRRVLELRAPSEPEAYRVALAEAARLWGEPVVLLAVHRRPTGVAA